MIVPCALCGEPVRTDELGTFRKATGWIEKRGATGGANALRLAIEHDEWAHGVCIDKEAHGIGARQASLGV